MARQKRIGADRGPQKQTENPGTQATRRLPATRQWLKDLMHKMVLNLTAWGLGKIFMILVFWLVAIVFCFLPPEKSDMQTKVWQLTTATEGHSPGDPENFKWLKPTLTPVASETPTMQIEGLVDGVIKLKFDRPSWSHHFGNRTVEQMNSLSGVVVCGEHGAIVFKFVAELRPGNFVHIVFFRLDESIDREFWWRIPEIGRRDSLGRLAIEVRNAADIPSVIANTGQRM